MDGIKMWSIVYTLFCFALIVFIAWPVSLTLAAIYILFVPFAACIPPLESCLDDVLGALKLPLFWAKEAVRLEVVNLERWMKVRVAIESGVGGVWDSCARGRLTHPKDICMPVDAGSKELHWA
ncbi:unnamed protein product [Hydatigera taeniaeformis]|uniref:Uncharacterized protein n=1 Tax=Hydatigena taeniaeformis TaxID=6205 RepID=A0A0R3X3J1_HYDTA|nr:unnamed protein product [Hydatigera taeniaeformis]